MKTMQTSEIPGPPFVCPECANAGKRFTTNARPGMGSHRLSLHKITGTSTGSNSYKIAHGRVVKSKTRTYTKRTPTVRGPYNKQKRTEVNPIVELLSNPAEFASNLDTLIYEKQAEVDKLQSQIQELNTNIAFLERFRSVATETPVQHFQEVA